MTDKNLINEFSKWFRFDEYQKQNGIELAGVYVLAHFDESRPTTVNLTSKNIVYIGETTKQNLRKRLYQFSRSAFTRNFGHSGGWTYSERYLNSEVVDIVPETLYVSFLPVDRPEKESKAYIKYIERLLIWEYFQKNDNYPPCNTA